MITIAAHEFQGPYSRPNEDVRDEKGVYVVLCMREGEVCCVLDVGESLHRNPWADSKGGMVRNRLKTHARRPCWESCAHGDIRFAVMYIDDESTGLGLELELQWKLSMRCGTNPHDLSEQTNVNYYGLQSKWGRRDGFDILGNNL